MYCACTCRVLLWMVIGCMVAPFLILSLLVVLFFRLELAYRAPLLWTRRMDWLWWVEIGYSLLLDRAGPVGGSVEHSEGKGGESAMAILRFLCGSPRPCRLRTAQFWQRWQALSCVLIACWVLWGLISRVAFVTTMSSPISLLRVMLLLWRENEAEGQDFIPGVGARFWPSRDLWTVVIHESL
jgi:hypothetical protein